MVTLTRSLYGALDFIIRTICSVILRNVGESVRLRASGTGESTIGRRVFLLVLLQTASGR